MAEVEHNVQNVTEEVPQEASPDQKENVECEKNTVDVSTETTEAEESPKSDVKDEIVEEKENLSQQLSQSAPVAVVPPTKRVLEESQDQDEETEESPLKKTKVLEESSNTASQEIATQ